MPQLRIHPVRAFEGGFGITGSGGALMYMDGLGVQKNRGPTKLLELSWASISWVVPTSFRPMRIHCTRGGEEAVGIVNVVFAPLTAYRVRCRIR